VPTVGFELTTYRLQGGCSTPELCGLKERYFTVFPAPEGEPTFGESSRSAIERA